MNENMIAMCGMNCSLCVSYQAMVNDINKAGFHRRYCPGCVDRGKNCTFMKEHCNKVAKGLVRFCFECDDFPCKRLKALDHRYKTKYNMSMIDNLNDIKDYGMSSFLAKQEKKWQCEKCGGVVSCHVKACIKCDIDKMKSSKLLEKSRRKDEESK